MGQAVLLEPTAPEAVSSSLLFKLLPGSVGCCFLQTAGDSLEILPQASQCKTLQHSLLKINCLNLYISYCCENVNFKKIVLLKLTILFPLFQSYFVQWNRDYTWCYLLSENTIDNSKFSMRS